MFWARQNRSDRGKIEAVDRFPVGGLAAAIDSVSFFSCYSVKRVVMSQGFFVQPLAGGLS